MALSWETPEVRGRKFAQWPGPDGGEHLPISSTPQGSLVNTYLPPRNAPSFGMQLAFPVHGRTQSIVTGAGEETA